MTLNNTSGEQTITVPLPVGSQVVLFEDIDIDSQDGYSASILFEGHVEKYVPQTRLLEFEESDVELAEFEELLEEAEGVEVIRAEQL